MLFFRCPNDSTDMVAQPRNKSRFIWRLFVVTTLALSTSLPAQDSNGNAVSEDINLRDLPAPPDDLETLIKQGTVKFLVGQRPRNGQDNQTGGQRKPMAAETHFQLSFDYRSRTKWRVNESAGKTELVITASFDKIKLKKKHDVWFRRRPNDSDFWKNRLVLHEFDHIRLSSDPGVEKLFVQKLRDSNVIKHEISDSSHVNNPLIRKLVSDRAQSVFNEVVELVSIRYRELDRQTSHGLRPLPDDSSLSKWLR